MSPVDFKVLEGVNSLKSISSSDAWAVTRLSAPKAREIIGNRMPFAVEVCLVSCSRYNGRAVAMTQGLTANDTDQEQMVPLVFGNAAAQAVSPVRQG